MGRLKKRMDDIEHKFRDLLSKYENLEERYAKLEHYKPPDAPSAQEILSEWFNGAEGVTDGTD